MLVNAAFLLAALEWLALSRAQGRRVQPWMQGAGMLLVLNSGFCPAEMAFPLTLVGSAMVIAIARALRPPIVATGADIGAALFGLVYIGALGSFIPRLLLLPAHPDVPVRYVAVGTAALFLFFLMTWATDTCAYFAGLLFGKHPLFPRVSPKKSVEGLIGGVAGASLFGWIGAQTFAPFILGWDAVGLGATIAVIGQLGDLVESALKRDAGVKDASSILPGHGGILDRLDSLLFAAPCVYVYLRYVVL
jgi:phosphatidate cytidylyltransferase